MSYAADILTGIFKVDGFNTLFFSKKNIDDIQRILRFKIYKSKKVIIAPQDVNQMLSVMRSLYGQYSKNPTSTRDYQRDLALLNGVVVDALFTMVNDGVSESLGFINYGLNPQPGPDVPINTSTRGTLSNVGTPEAPGISRG